MTDVLVRDEKYLQRSKKLADELGSELIYEINSSENSGLVLCYDERGLFLTDGELCVRSDFADMQKRLKAAGAKTELILKAAKIKKDRSEIRIVDATAGMGEDAVILAAAGYNVTMYEKDPVIAAILNDNMERSAKNPLLAPVIERMTLIKGDSVEAMKCMNGEADIILLDPMFPARSKSALIKKKFQLIHLIEAPCDNEEELLNAAFAANPKKILVKRPVKGAFLANKKPDYSISGKAIRYDCFVFAN